MPRTDPLRGDADWRPGATPATLALRAGLLARIREWFRQQGVLEVDTPVLSRCTATEPSIEPFVTSYCGPGSRGAEPVYLHSSPEYFMKRLLASGSGPVYQLARVFRNGEYGHRHNPEFTLLEWYRPGIDHRALMDDMDHMLASVLDGLAEYRPAARITYRQWFIEHTGLDPWRDDVAAFRNFAENRIGPLSAGMQDAGLEAWLDLLVTHWLEARLPAGPVFVCDYPPAQAALARIREEDGVRVAERFELYIDGVELANGFHELTDVSEQAVRLEQENRARVAAGGEALPVDTRFLAALESGMPDSAGVALGFDRLVMYAAGLEDIGQAVAFGFERV